MEWHFINTKTIEEYNTGYVIRLLEGTWLSPVEILPKSPRDMGAIDQTTYLRLGLEYAKEIHATLIKKAG